jgi:hypothetical protein
MAALKEPQFADNNMVPESVPAKRQATPPTSKARRFRPVDEMPYLTADDVVRVRNDDKEPLGFGWNNIAYVVQPGEEGIVPFPAIVDALGDPRSVRGQIVRFTDNRGNRGFIPERYEELKRLMVNYGVYLENIDDESEAAHLAAQVPMTQDCSLVSRAPKVTVHTQKGVRLTFPAQIPDMLPYPVEENAGRAGVVDQRRAVDKLASENAALLDRLEAMEQLLNERLGGATVDPGPRKPE